MDHYQRAATGVFPECKEVLPDETPYGHYGRYVGGITVRTVLPRIVPRKILNMVFIIEFRSTMFVVYLFALFSANSFWRFVQDFPIYLNVLRKDSQNALQLFFPISLGLYDSLLAACNARYSRAQNSSPINTSVLSSSIFAAHTDALEIRLALLTLLQHYTFAQYLKNVRCLCVVYYSQQAYKTYSTLGHKSNAVQCSDKYTRKQIIDNYRVLR